MAIFTIPNMVQIRFTSTVGFINTVRREEPAWHSPTEQGREKNTKKAEPEGEEVLEKACLNYDKFLCDVLTSA